MRCLKNKQNFKKDQSGQAIMEFLLGLMIVISFFAFFIKMSAVFVVANYIHYATFMSSRAYMSSDKTLDDQQEHAESVLSKMVGNRWKALITPNPEASGNVKGGYIGAGPYAQENPKLDSWNYGTTFSYSAKLSAYPWSQDGQSVLLKLTSESWMPREESGVETEQVRAQVTALLAQAGQPGVLVEWDNGR